MKVLIVHCGKGIYGGAEEVIVQLAKHLRLNHYVLGVLKDVPYKMIKELNEAGIGAMSVHSYLEMYRLAHRVAKSQDVINVHNFPATLAPFPTNKPIVWMCNEPAELFTNWGRKPIEAFNRWWVKKSGMDVVVADQMNAHRFRRIYGVEPRIIPYGVDYGFWSRGERASSGDSLKMLQVGTITPYKNQLRSISILAELLLEGLDVTLTLAGGFTDTRYYNRLVNDCIPSHNNKAPGIRDRVEIMGQVSKEEVRRLYLRHNLLLHPVQGQGGWLVPFEAMCAGLPVIACPEFSASDIIQSNLLGLVSDNRGFTATRAILDRKYQRIDTERVRLWVKDNLNWERFGEGMLGIFKEAINKKCF